MVVEEVGAGVEVGLHVGEAVGFLAPQAQALVGATRLAAAAVQAAGRWRAEEVGVVNSDRWRVEGDELCVSG